tara:strand:+ start:133 stop:453 length:321 start_codon:yes stop_codon:yes gene_type:complete
LYPNIQNIIPAIENKPIFFAQITDTLFDVTIPDSNIANPAAINMTKKPQTRKRNVLKINPTSAETVVSATPALLMLSKSRSAVAGVIIFLKIFLILSPLKLIKENF